MSPLSYKALDIELGVFSLLTDIPGSSLTRKNHLFSNVIGDYVYFVSCVQTSVQGVISKHDLDLFPLAFEAWQVNGCFHRRVVVGVIGVYKYSQSLDFSVVVCDNGVRSKWVVNGYWVVE